MTELDQHQLAAMIAAALKLEPTPIRILPEHTRRCDCRADSGQLLLRVVIDPAGELVLWIRGNDDKMPDAAMTFTDIGRMPNRTWIYLPRCRACGATWFTRATISGDSLELIATRRGSWNPAVVTE